ncbi:MULTISPECIES: S6 family peptidase [unclassified Helicobacter]|uniref:S6 family peptidase n=1 Tax=unclassified Helicobacter TaxID=2593540 RepID=UPI0013155F97|nr:MULTISPECIES: S6 family peptidase [unclassified Helicobacter]
MKKSLIIGLSFGASVAFSNIADYNFSYQYYLDFGQNKGKFTPGATNLTLTEKNTGKVFALNAPMPDFIGSTDNSGVATLVYGSYIFTATHTIFGSLEAMDFTYTKVDSEEMEVHITDTGYVRYDKFFTGLVSPDGFLELGEGEGLDTTRYTENWRTGQGAARYRKENGEIVEIQGAGIRTGGRLRYSHVLGHGKIQFDIQDTFLSNTSTAGDSGSPMFVWDTLEQKWVVIGALNSSNRSTFTIYAPYRQSELDKLIERNTNPAIALNHSKVLWDSGEKLGDFEAKNNKDLILQGGGEIFLGSNIDQGHGGIYFDENQHYVFKSADAGESFFWKGAGLSIGEGSQVDWYVKGVGGKKYTSGRPGYEVIPDSLHKIGKGTLNVFVANEGFLRLGDGKVVLNTQDLAFDGIVLVSGRPTLELIEGKGSSIDPDRVFFFSRGGTLDIKGNDFTFNIIQASDNGARIINTGSKIAKIDIKKKMSNALDMPIEGSGSFLFHGNIGNNIIIYKDGQSQEACPWSDTNPTFCESGYGENLLAFDGNITNPDGKIEHYNGKLVLQGHPVIHAYLPKGSAEHVARITGDDIYSTPTRLDQEDWENRIFVLDEIVIAQKDESTQTIDNSSIFILGRNATLLSSIKADRTKVYFGGDQKIYSDSYDGENVRNTSSDLATFLQKAVAGVSQKDETFYFEGNLGGINQTNFVISNTSSNPLKFGTFEAKDKRFFRNNKIVSLDLVPTSQNTYTISLDSTSSFKARYVDFYGNNQALLSGGTENSIAFLRLFNQQSVVLGDLFIKDIFLGSDESSSTLSYDSAITFHSLLSTLSLTGTLSLSNGSALLFDNKEESFVYAKYNTPYNLIKANTILDSRTSKDVIFLNPDYLRTINPKTITTPSEINLVFEKKQNDIVVGDKNLDWLDTYILNVQNESDEALAVQKLEKTNQITGQFRGLLESIARTNDRGQKVFKDIFTDVLILGAGDSGNIGLYSFLEEVDSNLSKIANSDFSLNLGLLNTIVNFSSLRNQKSLNQQIAKVDFKAKAYLAQNDKGSLDFKDYKENQNLVLDSLVSQKDVLDYRNSVYASIVGSYYNYEGSLGATGITMGYDRILLQEPEHYLSVGASFSYLYGIYNQASIRQNSQAFIFGLHTQYFYKNNEFLVQFFGGIGLNEKTTKIVSNFQLNELNATTSTTDFLANTSLTYKYRFLLQKSTNLYQALKPVVSLGYQHFYIPGSLNNDVFHFEKINQGIPNIEVGLEYNISTQKIENILQMNLKYNLQTIGHRKVGIGTSAPLDYRINMQDLYVGLTYLGNVSFGDSLFLNYQISAELSPINPNYFGVLGNVGLKYQF